MRVGPGHEPPRPAVTVRVRDLPHQPPAKCSATNQEALLRSCEHTLPLLCPLCCPQAPASPEAARTLYTEEKVHTSPWFHPSNCPGAPGPASSHRCPGLSRPLRSPPPPSRDHFSAHRPFCLMAAPNTKTSWISLLRRPLFFFTESPERASCTRNAVSPAAPTPSPHGMPPTPARRHPCLTLHSTHSRFPFARLLLGGLGHNLILVPPPPSLPTTVLSRGEPTLPGGLSQAWPLQAPRFYLCSSRTASCPQASPGCPKRIERHFTLNRPRPVSPQPPPPPPCEGQGFPPWGLSQSSQDSLDSTPPACSAGSTCRTRQDAHLRLRPGSPPRPGPHGRTTLFLNHHTAVLG